MIKLQTSHIQKGSMFFAVSFVDLEANCHLGGGIRTLESPRSWEGREIDLTKERELF